MLRCIASLAAFAAISVSCLAQDGSTGAIRGTVLDPSGNRVAGATVALVNDETGVHYEQSSDNRGQFAFELLPPGDYSARVAGEGMSPQLSPGIHVAIGGASEITFKLALAGAHESVTVSAEPHSVETQPRGLSSVLDERAIQNLPLNGRRFTDLSLLTPGRYSGSAWAELWFERRPELRRCPRISHQLPCGWRRQ
jgi:Carboxypeptidase regulatory-like domain